VILYSTVIKVQSTRLFPKRAREGGYKLTDLAEYCDWVILSDQADPKAILFAKNKIPSVIFFSLRNSREAISFFYTAAFPKVRDPFVFISSFCYRTVL
jgi:hypothetical protein